MNLSERCLLHLGGPPMMPMPYNNDVQIVQTSDHVMILNETSHEFRVIPLGARLHLPSNIRQWKGDSRGYWDGAGLGHNRVSVSGPACLFLGVDYCSAHNSGDPSPRSPSAPPYGGSSGLTRKIC